MSRTVASLERGLLRRGYRGRLARDVPLAPFTTWRIGGPAELLAIPGDRRDVELAVRGAEEAGIAWRVLGNGSNLLVRDRGVPGLVIRVRRTLDFLRIAEHRVEVGAGASFPSVARKTAAAGLQGLEFGAGIPGTIGGAVAMNAGWHEFEIGNFIESVEYLDPVRGTVVLDRRNCRFGYRTSAFRGRSGVVLQATLRLTPGIPSTIQERLEGFAASRKENQPTELASCGSVFLKPPGDFAGRLIEAAGLKGLQVGQIQVSPKHANFFVNLGGGTAEQVLALTARVEREVASRFDVELTREFEVW